MSVVLCSCTAAVPQGSHAGPANVLKLLHYILYNRQTYAGAIEHNNMCAIVLLLLQACRDP